MVDWKKFDEEFDRYAAIFQEALEQKLDLTKAYESGWFLPYTQTAATIALYKSSRRLEHYNVVLAGLTTILTVLTIVLILRGI